MSQELPIAIIGGGAAGLMAAATIREAAPDQAIVLIEKNPDLGRKIIISGGGRCNLTTGLRDVREVLTRYPRGGKFLAKAMHRFTPEDAYVWFEAHGIPLKVEEDLRVFPCSDDGHDVVKAFEKILRRPNTEIIFKAAIHAIIKTDQGFVLSFQGNRPAVHASKVFLCAGGQAYRQTGSTGDGYALAQSLGHTITPLAPSLSALGSKEAWPAEISGLSFERAELRAKSPSGKKFSFVGPFLFTHKGVSGPAVFALSSQVAFEKFDATHPLLLEIDVFPDVTAEDLFARLTSKISAAPKKSLENLLATLVSKSLATILCRELRLDDPKHAVEWSKKDLQRAVAWLKGIPLHVIARSPGDEFVTAGGVETKEVDPATMQSKICPGLYFAGEILDIDAYTGGFNLQSAWATGKLAGESALR